jgi:hypothetical protein
MRINRVPVRWGVSVLVFWGMCSVASADRSADINQDGEIDARDLFLLANQWDEFFYRGDLDVNLHIDQGDLLSFIRQFHRRLTPTPTRTPVPTGRLAPPEWVHPAPEHDETFFCFDEAVAGGNDHFLKWMEVPGASGYVYDLEIIPDGPPPVFFTPHVQRLVTPTPGEPNDHSGIYAGHLYPAVFYSQTGRAFFEARIAALDTSPTPQVGQFSEARLFWIERCPVDTPTPSPTLRPTVQVDLDSSGKVDSKDLLLFQNWWHRTEGEGPQYSSAMDFNLDKIINVRDLLLFREWYKTKHGEFGPPQIVAPPYGYQLRNARLSEEGLTFEWEPHPTTIIGGVAYQFEFWGPADGPVSFRYGGELNPVVIHGNSVHLKLSLGVDPSRLNEDYYWRVRAISPYGLREPGPYSSYPYPFPSWYEPYHRIRVTFDQD